jgi:hypothetical protein
MNSLVLAFEDPFAKKSANAAVVAPPKEFRVSRANSNPENKKLFMALWEELSQPRLNTDSILKTFTVMQASGKEGDLHRYICQHDTAVLLENGELLEGAAVRVWVDPAGVYDFKTVAGFTRRVALYKEAVAKTKEGAPTREEFVTALKAGETFTVVTMAEGGCGKCFGDGKLGAIANFARCGDCAGSGEIKVTWVLKW